MNNTTRSVIITLAALVFLTGTGMVAASPATTKASPLYPIKKAIEAASLALAAPENKAEIQAALLEQRVAELDALKLQIDVLERNQELEKAQRLQEAARATEFAAKQTVVQAKVDAQLITNETKKTEVLGKITSSSQRIDDDDEDDVEEREAPEQEETLEPKEIENESENKEKSKSENKNDSKSNKEGDED